MRPFKIGLWTILVGTIIIAGLLMNQGENMNVQLEFQREFPEKYTCDGEDISPAVKFSGLPDEAETVALVMDDPDAPGQVFNHWLIWNIPASENLPENIPRQRSLDNGAVHGQNDFGDTGYGGPCPPDGSHTYRIKVYALDTELSLKSGAGREQLEAAMQEHIVKQITLKRVYSR